MNHADHHERDLYIWITILWDGEVGRQARYQRDEKDRERGAGARKGCFDKRVHEIDPDGVDLVLSFMHSLFA